MKHREKLKLARRNLTKEEIKEKIPIFQSKYWEARKTRVKRETVTKELNAKEASRLRKEKELLK